MLFQISDSFTLKTLFKESLQITDMDKEIIEFLNEVMDCPEVPRRLRLWALQIKTSKHEFKNDSYQVTKPLEFGVGFSSDGTPYFHK